MATEKQSHKLYNDTIEITFYPNSHKYQLKGEKTFLISATAITGVVDKSRMLIPWATGLARDFLINTMEQGLPITREVILEAVNLHTVKKDEAASTGKMVHDYAQKFAEARIANTVDPEIPSDAPETALNGIMAFLEWVKAHKVKFMESERLVFSKSLGYVGITDLIATVDGELTIIDYKTSKGIYDEHYFQLSGYWKAYEEEVGDYVRQGLLLHFDKESGNFTAHTITPAENDKNFSAFSGLYLAKMRLKEMTNEYYKANK